MPYDLAVSLLSVYPKKTKTLIQKDICTSMFITALFIIAKIWKQSKSSPINEWIRRMWHIYVNTHTHPTPTHTLTNGIFLIKNEIFPFMTTWIYLEGIMLSEIDRNTNTV